MNNKILMTALCALGVAGSAMTTEAAPRRDRGHREGATKTFQREMSHVGADLISDLGHSAIGAVFGRPATVVVPVEEVPPPPRVRRPRPRRVRPVVVEQPVIVQQPVVVEQPVVVTQPVVTQPVVVQQADTAVVTQAVIQATQNQR